MSLKILNDVNYAEGLGADRWVGEGLKAAFEDLGHEFYWFEVSYHDLGERILEVRPDIMFTSQSMLAAKNLPVFSRFRKGGGKVILRVDSFFDRDQEVKDALVNGDFADIYYGEVEDPHMDHFKKMTGKAYYISPNAAHQRLHFPTEAVEKYKCDIVFLGAMMPNKKEALETLLLPLAKKYDVKIYGPGWTLKDNVLRSLARASRELGLRGVNAWISKQRLQIPAEDENKLYSSAKICLNIHERAEHIKSHVVLNERTFKIPACGGFEICDFVPPLRRYFAEDEMVMAGQQLKPGEVFGMDDLRGDWVKDWFDKIDYYLKHDDERKAIQKRGAERALRDHTYIQRVKKLLSLLGFE